jgi:hypothetical protein
MNEVWLGVARVVPSGLFDNSAPFESSSNQLLCFVASFVIVIGTLRSAAKIVAESMTFVGHLGGSEITSAGEGTRELE